MLINVLDEKRVMQKIDEILSDLKLEGNDSESFNFKEYLDE